MRALKSRCLGILGLCLLVAFFIPIINLVLTLFKNGKSALNLSLITQMTPPPSMAGGLLNAWIGSFEMVGFALLIAIPVGVLLGNILVLHKQKRWIVPIQLMNDTLLSLPSILYGLFVYLLIVVPMGHFSALAGGLALSLLAIPMVARSSEDLLLILPPDLREAGFALGACESSVVKLLILSIFRGLIGIIILTFARLLGETAPLLFTSLSSPYLNKDFLQPTASLPVTLYNFAMSPDPSWQALASAGALLMIAIVLFASALARYFLVKRSAP
jgi:phosphate transport system permease protein